MELRPVLTIIIPHYNTPRGLDLLLKTIPDYAGIQTVVVDDRSTKRLDEYEALKPRYPHVAFVRNNSSGKGAGAARNVGLRLARGKWLLFADADDTFAPGFYDIVSAYFETAAELVYFPPLSYYGDSQKEHCLEALYAEYIERYRQTGSPQAERTLRCMWHTPWSRLIRREMLDKHGITFSETQRANDLFFAVRAGVRAATIAVGNGSIYIRRMRSGSTVSSMTPAKVRDWAGELIRKYCFLREALHEDDFLRLPLHGIMIIARFVLEGYSPGLILETIRMMRASRVRLFHKGFFNPAYIWRMLSRYCRHKWYAKNIESFESREL